MLKRIATAAVLIPVIVILVYWGPSWLVTVLAALVALLALFEFFKLSAQMGLHAFRAWTMICAAGLFYAQWAAGGVGVHRFGSNLELVQGATGIAASMETIILVFIFGAAFIGIASRKPIADVLPGIAASAGGLLMIALPFSYLVRMDSRPRGGAVLVLFTLALIWAGDTLAYFVGKSIGRVKMAPALSPNKTWEGAAANVLGSLIVAVFFARWQGGDLTPWLITAALANVAGQVGDLVESAYKRGAGAKDSGALLPGHGGMLDRIDSLILAAPVVWLAAAWLLQGRP
jgi:phosphatidate cytidylyltransferase